jgi:hypothetical protein
MSLRPKYFRAVLALPVIVLPIIVMAASWPALAETDAERQACMNDAQVHCADQIPDRDQVYACLIRKVSTLSAPCKRIITTAIRSNRRSAQ